MQSAYNIHTTSITSAAVYYTQSKRTPWHAMLSLKTARDTCTYRQTMCRPKDGNPHPHAVGTSEAIHTSNSSNAVQCSCLLILSEHNMRSTLPTRVSQQRSLQLLNITAPNCSATRLYPHPKPISAHSSRLPVPDSIH
jgi:hypothetical protein